MLSLETYELANGLRVVLNEDHSAPLVAVNLWYHVGSKNERPGRTGFAHLFEHMLFSGSKHVGNNEHFRYVQSVGGVLNGTTFFDRTNYFETLPSNYLALGLWLESDRMGFFLPALTQEKLDIQREVVKEERRQRYDNVPYGTAFERLLNLAYDPDYSYHWPTIGSMEDLGAASLDDQIATDVAAYVLPTEAAGMLMLQATAKEGISIDEVEKAIDAEIERIAGGGVTEEELVRAKTRSEVEFAHQIENYDTRADVLGTMATYFGDATMTQRWLEPYEAAEAADIARMTATRLGQDDRVTIHFLPEGQ